MNEKSILATEYEGEKLEQSHGYPLRLVIPHLYGWKSAKWINGIELMEEDSPGFWEQRGYNNNANPWEEERFWPELNK